MVLALARLAGAVALCLAGLWAAVVGQERPAAGAVVPLVHAHAHNDYEHARPLADALGNGFCSVEADVFLVGNRLLVGHSHRELKPDRTLERLYLDPLRRLVKANGGRVYPGGPTVFLLIDVKTDANLTYSALDRLLGRYADILSVTRKGRFEPNAVTAVISGNRARAQIAAQPVRFAGIDGRSDDLNSEVAADLMPWISDRWGKLFRWDGVGPMPANERTKLRTFVDRAHRHGRLVRFWATPERPAVWKELRAAGVDLINTDQLDALRDFLLAEQPGHGAG